VLVVPGESAEVSEELSPDVFAPTLENVDNACVAAVIGFNAGIMMKSP
jgi:hypothetical protein